ncbi:MAG: class I SAM-dependent methyltransferase [Beijerinckiaceae bacterium]
MRLLYGRHYGARCRVIADLIPNGSNVLDVCCGPATLFSRHLVHKSVRYSGLDLNPVFVRRVCAAGGNGIMRDMRRNEPLPHADYVIMQASLYHFLPDARSIVERMLEAANIQVIIAEPIRNLASSDNRLVALAAKYLTNPGSGAQPSRFTEASLDRLFEFYRERIERTFLIPGGREKVFVLGAK